MSRFLFRIAGRDHVMTVTPENARILDGFPGGATVKMMVEGEPSSVDAILVGRMYPAAVSRIERGEVVIGVSPPDQAGAAQDSPFEPSPRQIELMEHAVGGDWRHRNRFLAAGDDIAPWRELVRAGLAFEDPAFGQGEMVSFHVSPAGLALLDARARPRILEAKARAWDSLAGALGEVDVEADGGFALAGEMAWNLIMHVKVTTPVRKGPRAIAEETKVAAEILAIPCARAGCGHRTDEHTQRDVFLRCSKCGCACHISPQEARRGPV